LASLHVGPARASSLLPLFVVQFFFPFVQWFILVLINSMVVASPAVFPVQKKNLIAKCTCLKYAVQPKIKYAVHVCIILLIFLSIQTLLLYLFGAC